MTDDLERAELPLFPLNTVLLPGVALPLHIFEERYRLMIGRCVERRDPFGVVLIRQGREVGSGSTRLAEIGTVARIRQASRYADGRMDIVTVGVRRFRIDELHASREPYLTAEVTLLDEPLGADADARQLSQRVGRSFLRYLELLQPALATDDTPEIEIEIEIEAPDDDRRTRSRCRSSSEDLDAVPTTRRSTVRSTRPAWTTTSAGSCSWPPLAG